MGCPQKAQYRGGSNALFKWFQHNGSAYLLRTKAGQPLGSNGITKALGRIGLQHLQRRLGSSLLRHSYLSHKYKDTLDEKKEDADLMKLYSCTACWPGWAPGLAR
jgi:hypothetical protein